MNSDTFYRKINSVMFAGMIAALLFLLCITPSLSAEDNEKITELIKVVKGNDCEARVKASEELIRIGKPAVPHLIKLLNVENEEVSMTVVGSLARIGEPSVEPLIGMLKSDNSFVRTGAVCALGKICDKRAVEPIIPLLGDKDSIVRAFAAEALGEIGDKRAVEPLTKAINDRQTRSQAFNALEKIGKPSTDAIIGFLDNENENLKRMAIQALGRIGSLKGAPPLEKMLDNKNEDIRNDVIDSLGSIGAASSVPILMKMVKNGDNIDLKKRVMKALGSMKNPDAVKALTEIFRINQDELCLESVRILGEKGKDSITVLAVSSKDKEERVRFFSILAMEKIESPAVVKALTEALKDEKPAVRLAAVRIIEKKGDKSVVENLRKVLNDKNEHVREAAKKAIEKLENS